MSAFFNHAGASPPADAVVDRMIRHLRREQEVGGYEAAAEVGDELGATRSSLATLVGGSADEIALTSGATDAFERAMWAHLSAPRGPDPAGPPRVIVDPFTYSSMWATLSRWSAFRPLSVAVAAARPDGTVDVDSLAELADERTDTILLTHIPTHRGTVTDAGAAIAIARQRSPRALIALDVSQSVGQLPLDVAALGPDLAFAPGRKFLRSPRGTGFLWVRRDVMRTLVPLSLPFGAAIGAGGVASGLPDDATRFETFERPIAALLGFGVAVGELLAAGVDHVSQVVLERSDRVRDVVAEHPSLRALGTPSDRGIITFAHPILPADEVVRRLARWGVASRPMPPGLPMADGRGAFEPCVRLSPHAHTSDDELALLDEALSRLD